MISPSMSDRALGALFGTVRVRGLLNQFLESDRLNRAEGQSAPLRFRDSVKLLRAAISEGIDERTGSVFGRDQIESEVDLLCHSTIVDMPAWPQLDALYSVVMDRSAPDIQFKHDQIFRYAGFISELDPTVLVAWDLAAQADAEAIAKAIEKQTTLFAGSHSLSHFYAENHAHLNGIAGDEVVLSQLIFHPRFSAMGDAGQAPIQDEIPDLRPIKRSAFAGEENLVLHAHGLLKCFLSLWQMRDPSADTASESYNEAIISAALANPDPTLDVIQWEEVAGYGAHADAAHAHRLRWMVVKMGAAVLEGNLQQAWTWLFVLLWKTYRCQETSAAIRAAILMLICDAMALRRQLIMHGYGLRRFTSLYMFSKPKSLANRDDRWKSVVHKEAIRRLFSGMDDKVEIKISAGEFSKNEKFQVAKVVAAAVDKHLGSLRLFANESVEGPSYKSLEQWHFCLHFNRSGGKTRHARRRALWTEAKEVKDALGSVVPIKLTNEREDSTDMAGLSCYPGELVRGLDVAGDETKWDIEVFAPMLRWVRHSDMSGRLDVGIDFYPRRLHLSIHAGEDYRHPLSGLRHVDETVRFCDMQNGDRLGHALALGIDPLDWFQQNQNHEIELSIDEHVDNLVWAWGEANKLRDDFPKKMTVMSRFEERISRFLPYVSWWPSAQQKWSCQLLYEAWELRRNCSYMVQQAIKNVRVEDEQFRIAIPDWKLINTSEKNPTQENIAYQFFIRRAFNEQSIADIVVRVKMPAWHKNGIAASQKAREIDRPDEENKMFDHDNADEICFMRALQDACMERYAISGIAIEANPTSNVYIGKIGAYCDHPLFRWAPLGGKDALKNGARHNTFGLRTLPLEVTINTDDQGIIPTTLRLEHRLIRACAEEYCGDKDLVSQWMEGIRRTGIAHFERARASRNS